MIRSGRNHYLSRIGVFTSRAFFIVITICLSLSTVFMLSGCVILDTFTMQSQLTDPQRREFLAYYSPIILKRADENDHEHYGYDWITNFDFDRDGDFSTNRTNWKSIDHYVKSSGRPADYNGPLDFASWQIRPTLYTALIEFMDNGQRSLVLIYHVYNAEQHHRRDLGNGQDIHDWERIEIRINNIDVVRGPGSGENIQFVVLTNHKDHFAKSIDDPGISFMDTDTGRHVLVWQAQWSGKGSQNRIGELHFVKESVNTIRDRDKASTKLNGEGDDRKSIHYVFVCNRSTAAVAQWDAQTLSWSNAGALASKRKNRITWGQVRRITYELQDIADIIPTHWERGGYETHWFGKTVDIFLDGPILGESGDVEVAAGLQKFYTRSLDDIRGDGKGGRFGYPIKSWFWGVYKYGGSGKFRDDAFGSILRTRANLDEGSLGSYWKQHDYFAHDGSGKKDGHWLPYEWQVFGFDGRWVQLFPNDP